MELGDFPGLALAQQGGETAGAPPAGGGTAGTRVYSGAAGCPRGAGGLLRAQSAGEVARARLGLDSRAVNK